jgi:hypothetical protein
MKDTLVFVALLLSCGKPTQKQSSPESLKISDSYAKAAMFSLLAIESDLSITEDRNGQKVVTEPTQSKIDAADAEAGTKQEESMTKVLRQVYERKLEYNRLRKAEHDYLDAEIKGYPIDLEYHRLYPNTQLYPSKDGIRKTAARVDQDDAEESKRETECFEPLKQALRDRLSINPEPCIQWISPKPVMKSEQ